MSVVLVFILVVLGLALWWLSQQRLMSRPWLEVGVAAHPPSAETTGLPTEKIALVIVLAVIGALFALFASAYFMRAELSDWRQVPLPPIVWVSTVLLCLASVAMHTALVAERRQDGTSLRLSLVTAAVATLGFLLGQTFAWLELVAAGFLLVTNPADSFFYLLTGAHGLHILVGLAGIAGTTAGAFAKPPSPRLRLHIDLCTTYAHFLLFIWAAILVLLTGWADDFVEICRTILS
jgi:cytochrome c oxidase subunit III